MPVSSFTLATNSLQVEWNAGTHLKVEVKDSFCYIKGFLAALQYDCFNFKGFEDTLVESLQNY